jgi:hypothetical protein
MSSSMTASRDSSINMYPHRHLPTGSSCRPIIMTNSEVSIIPLIFKEIMGVEDSVEEEKK